jgi:hypothetical protein
VIVAVVDRVELDGSVGPSQARCTEANKWNVIKDRGIGGSSSL